MESTAARPAGKYMDWKVDWAFKKVFSDKEVASKLLRDILREDIVDIEFLSNEDDLSFVKCRKRPNRTCGTGSSSTVPI